MIKEKVLALADYLENEILDKEFDMKNYFINCGTVACIAGHECIRIGNPHGAVPASGENYPGNYEEAAAISLGLEFSENCNNELFAPGGLYL